MQGHQPQKESSFRPTIDASNTISDLSSKQSYFLKGALVQFEYVWRASAYLKSTEIKAFKR
jgi:hypothetical protein